MDSELFDICVLYDHTVVFSGFLLLCVLLVKLISFHVFVGFVLFFCSVFFVWITLSHVSLFLFFFFPFFKLQYYFVSKETVHSDSDVLFCHYSLLWVLFKFLQRVCMLG